MIFFTFMILICSVASTTFRTLRSLPSWQYRPNPLLLYSTNEIQYDEKQGDADFTREAIVRIIEKSWFKVCQMIPQSTLEQCEVELREATSLLVLAAVRRSALSAPSSRIAVQQMFEKADQNQDGRVSFSEWFDWLSQSIESDENRYDLGRASIDPMIEALGRVLSYAVCTVRIAIRSENDPSYLSAAFVAGGVLSGALDKSVCEAMLNRLSPQTRELVTRALSLESGTMPPSTNSGVRMNLADVGVGVDNVEFDEGSYNLFFDHLCDDSMSTRVRAQSMWATSAFVDYTDLYPSGSINRLEDGNENCFRKSTATRYLIRRSNAGIRAGSVIPEELEVSISERSQESNAVLQIIDFASVPILTAPQIYDDNDMSIIPNGTSPTITISTSNQNVQSQPQQSLALASTQVDLTTITTSDSYKIAFSSISPTAEPIESDKTEMVISLQPQISSNFEEELQCQNDSIASTRCDNTILVPNTGLAKLDLESTFSGPVLQSPEEMYANASRTLRDIQQARSAASDLGDGHSATIRQLIASKATGRSDVAGLALALRATRLQHAITLPNALKQRLAVETLQVWAPLSFQMGLSAHVPELEVHSYVLLFPQSFQSFLLWFDGLRPLARRVLRKFREALANRLKSDPVLPSVALKVTIQSRVKSPSSAFKKMVRSAKQKQQIHDILGLRVIVTEYPPLSLSVISPLSLYPSPLTVRNSLRPHLLTSPVTEGAEYIDEASIIEHEEADKSSNIDSTGAVQGEDQLSDDLYCEEEEVDADDYSYSEDAVWRVHDIVQDICPTLDERNEPASNKFTTKTQAGSASADEVVSNDPYSDQPHPNVDLRLREERNRFKDYVSKPKPSGYQSLHMTLKHIDTGILMEVQIRSMRMHMIAEHGSASHRQYKALALPTLSTSPSSIPSSPTAGAQSPSAN